MQWLGMKEWLKNSQEKWENGHREMIVWGTGITDMTRKVLGKAKLGDVALAQEPRR
jgi:hypothetical protein